MHRLFYLVVFLAVCSFQRDTTGIPQPATPADARDLTVSYSIEIKSKRKNSGVGESYNGGVKTLFVSGAQTRLRLVSLMRMQSIFVLPGNPQEKKVVIAKESGKNKYKYYLNESDWEKYNKKYDGVTCSSTSETLTIAGYAAKKTIVTLSNGLKITVWYTPSIKSSALAVAEPVFSCIPGLPLKYEYSSRKGMIAYTASLVSHDSIDPQVFSAPGEDFPIRKMIPGQTAE